MLKQKLKWLNERTVFYAVLFFNLAIVCSVKFYPTGDGPAHLYNANIICHLLKGDSPLLSDFFAINKFPIPNWTDHFILSLVHFILPGWVAEKTLLIFYFTGIAISFRLLIKQVNSGNAALSIFIFPFSHSFLFYLGFYNNSLSFVFLFYTLYYWLKTRVEESFRKYLTLFILFGISYFTNVLSFFFTGMCIGLFIVTEALSGYLLKRDLMPAFTTTLKKLLKLFIIALPWFILFIIFYKTVEFYPLDNRIPASELIRWIYNARVLIVFDYTGEQIMTTLFFCLLVGTGIISFYLRIKKGITGNFLSIAESTDIFLLCAFIALILYFIIPDGSDAGMMSSRYLFIFFIFYITWIASKPLPKKIVYVIAPIFIILHVGLLLKHFNGTIKHLSETAAAINKSSKFITAKSVVLPVDLSDNWLEGHYSNYIGTDKPLIILDNYETVGWFPVCWNYKTLPRVLLDGKSNVEGAKWYCYQNGKVTKDIDYIYLYGNTAKIDDDKWRILKRVVFSSFVPVYIGEDKNIAIYKKI